MLISDILKEKSVTVSCELFPPKKHKGFEDAQAVVDKTAALEPDFISVTYGANGGAYKNTIRMAGYIQSRGCNALSHLTCLSSSQDQVAGLIAQMEQAQIENVLALRGDVPAQAHSGYAYYKYAIDLVRALKAHGGFCIGAACYPEGHVESASRAEDIRFLKEKVDAGCDFLTTQMFFDNNILYKFLYLALRAGIQVPVLAGIMPVTNKAQVKRIIEISDTALPPRFTNIVDKFGDDPEAMQQAGIAYATEQIIDLLANGVKGIHIYTMNKPHVAEQIMHNIARIVASLNAA